MAPELMIKISNDHKLSEYLINNSYWYKYLNRSPDNFKIFYNNYKLNNHNERMKKASNVVDSIETVNSILKVLK